MCYGRENAHSCSPDSILQRSSRDKTTGAKFGYRQALGWLESRVRYAYGIAIKEGPSPTTNLRFQVAFHCTPVAQLHEVSIKRGLYGCSCRLPDLLFDQLGRRTMALRRNKRDSLNIPI